MMRVVAMGGDTIGCPAGPTGRCDAIVRNGVPVSEPYLGGTATEPFPTSTVPAGTMFLMGDNRDAANDSRYIGPVSLSDVTGVAVRIRDRDGELRPVPGAPTHPGPGRQNNVDPPGLVPPADVVPR